MGAGLAFANRYNATGANAPSMSIAIAAYGDGAANQGQIWEAANMSKLWDLPMVFMIENNQYGKPPVLLLSSDAHAGGA